VENGYTNMHYVYPQMIEIYTPEKVHQQIHAVASKIFTKQGN
jgi:hypothetical protein